MKLWYENFWNGFNPNDFYFTDVLRTITNIEISKDNPDLLIHSVFGNPNNILKYKCKTAFWTGENILVGTNPIVKVLKENYPCDFSLSFDDDNNTNIQCPLWILYLDYKNKDAGNYYLKTTEKRVSSKKEFYCNFIYSNPAYNTSPRFEFFKTLSSIKKIHSSGKFANNTGVSNFDKKTYIRDFTFTIAFENSYDYFYNTEKLLEPLLSSSIPLYWGGEKCFDFFKKEQIVFCKNRSFENIFEEMEDIANDNERQLDMMSDAIFNIFPKQFEPKIMAEKILDMINTK